MLIVGKQWKINREEEKTEFYCEIKGLNSVEVYDYSELIERNDNLFLYHGDYYKVSKYGTKVDYANNKTYFYIETTDTCK